MIDRSCTNGRETALRVGRVSDMHSAKGAGSNEVAKTGWGEWNARCHRCKVTGWLRDSPVGVMDSRPSVCREKSKGNAWMAADGLDHTWPVTAIAVVAVAWTWTHEEGGLSRRD